MMAVVPTKPLRAVVYTKFPPKFIEDILKPKLIEHGVEVLRILDPEQRITPDLSMADIVILFIDLMGHSDAEHAKNLAKRYDKRVVTLTRQVSSWTELRKAKEKLLEKEKKQEAARAENVIRLAPKPKVKEATLKTSLGPRTFELPTQPTPHVDAESAPVSKEIPLSAEEREKLLKLYEEENERLEYEKTELIDRLKKSDDLNRALERQLETQKKDYEKKLSALEHQTRDMRRTNSALTDRAQDLMDEITAVKKEVSSTVTPIEKALEHFKALYKLKVMTATEILDKLWKE